MRVMVLALTAGALAACGPRYENDPSKAGPYPTVYRSIAASYVRTSFFDLAGCEFQAPQKCLRLIMVYAISFMP